MPVQARRSSRVTGPAYGSSLFFRSVPEVGFPVGSYKSSGFGAAAPCSFAASAARLVHPLSDVIDNSVDDVRATSFPSGGTGSKVSARRAGALGAIGVRRSLSTGRPVQADAVITSRAAVPSPRSAPQGGVRFSRYTTAMNIYTALSAPSVRSLGTFHLPTVVGAR